MRATTISAVAPNRIVSDDVFSAPFVSGFTVTAWGFAHAANNGTFKILSVSSDRKTLTLDTSAIVTESAGNSVCVLVNVYWSVSPVPLNKTNWQQMTESEMALFDSEVTTVDRAKSNWRMNDWGWVLFKYVELDSYFLQQMTLLHHCLGPATGSLAGTYAPENTDPGGGTGSCTISVVDGKPVFTSSTLVPYTGAPVDVDFPRVPILTPNVTPHLVSDTNHDAQTINMVSPRTYGVYADVYLRMTGVSTGHAISDIQDLSGTWDDYIGPANLGGLDTTAYVGQWSSNLTWSAQTITEQLQMDKGAGFFGAFTGDIATAIVSGITLTGSTLPSGIAITSCVDGGTNTLGAVVKFAGSTAWNTNTTATTATFTGTAHMATGKTCTATTVHYASSYATTAQLFAATDIYLDTAAAVNLGASTGVIHVASGTPRPTLASTNYALTFAAQDTRPYP